MLRTFHSRLCVRGVSVVALTMITACAPAEVALECEPWGTAEDVAARPSPYDSVTFEVGGDSAKVCYSRPFARGRVIFGELVPFDTLWRTGANEPTIVYLPFAAEIAGLSVEPGAYSIYTVPRQGEWSVVVNSSTSQWGLTMDAYGAQGNFFENAYTDEVRAREVGRAPIGTDSIEMVEQLVIRAEPVGAGTTNLLVEWETTRAVIPIRAQGAPSTDGPPAP